MAETMAATLGEVSGPGGAADGEIELNPEVLDIVNADQEKIEHLKQTVANRSDDSKALLEDWLNTGELESEGA